MYFENEKMAKEIKNNWNNTFQLLQSTIKDWRKKRFEHKRKGNSCRSILASQLVYVIQSIGLP